MAPGGMGKYGKLFKAIQDANKAYTALPWYKKLFKRDCTYTTIYLGKFKIKK